MATITIELSDEALALLAERALRRRRTTEEYGTQVLQQSLIFGDRDALNDLFYLKTVFGALAGFVGILLDPTHNTSPKIEEDCVTYIHRELERLAEFTDKAMSIQFETLELNRNTFGPIDIDFDPFPLRPYLEQILTVSRQSTYLKKSHHLMLEVSADVPETIEIDLNKFDQILYNLIDNALRFSPDGGEIKIHVSQPEPYLLLFTIKDQGLGMSPEFLPRFSQKFARADASEIRSINGTGFGAFLVRNYVEYFGGTLWAESEGLGKGTTVSFTLPTHPAIQRDPEFNSIVSELQRWRFALSALLAEINTLPRTHYRFDATARADFAQLVHAELEQMQAFLVGLQTTDTSLIP